MVGVTTATIDATELAARLRLGVTRLARRLRQETDADVTPSQLAALSTIERHQPMTVGDLSAHERVQPPTMTRVISALVDSGFVAREPDPSDRRVAWLRLSPEGARFLARGRTRKEAYLAKRLRRIEPERLVILEQAVDLLEELVEEDGR
jgi:DNA-binding MarR family transcriptional regulator